MSESLYRSPHKSRNDNIRKVIPNDTFKSSILKFDHDNQQDSTPKIKLPFKNKNPEITYSPNKIELDVIAKYNGVKNSKIAVVTKPRESHRDFLKSNQVLKHYLEKNFMKTIKINILVQTNQDPAY